MTHENETGFGSGLRKLLQKHEGEGENEVLVEEPVDDFDVVEAEPQVADVVAIVEKPEPAEAPLELLELR